MSEGNTLNEICDQMLKEYDVSREQLEHDVIKLAQELADKGLIAA